MTEGRQDYSILISLATREEADVAASALRAQGVDAFLGNEHSATAMPHTVLGQGGLQVMVPSAQLSEAKALLQARLKEWDEDDEGDEPAPRRGRWRAWILLFMIIGPAVLAILWTVGERIIGRVAQLLGG